MYPYDPEPWSTDQVRALARFHLNARLAQQPRRPPMQITNHANLPQAIVNAVMNDPYDAGACDISVTKLIGPPQIRVLEREHAEEVTEDASDRIWSLIGQIGHGILERAETAAIAERRLFADIHGWRLSGQFDRLTIDDDGSLADYKFTSVWAVADGPKPEWIAQLNVLRWLAAENGYPEIRRLLIIAVLRDWSKGKAKQGEPYPPHQVKVLPVPLWTLEESRRYIVGRIQLHKLADECAANGDPLPRCTDAERWAKPAVYAVRKPGRKSAVKLHDTEDAALAHSAEIPNGYVEHRPGESTRCADYCAVAEFCAQRRAELTERQQAHAEAA